ncbi:MAG: methyltransferase family protein [Candidatus Thorarchaeota archaeon]|jgi:protein-S-isoprenylcysteine O-methyltransferase Ste14
MSRWEEIIFKVSTTLASAAVYLPIVAGIITPMIYLFPGWYISWYIAAYIFPFYEIWHGFWFPISDMTVASIIWLIEGGVFVFGIGIFLWSLFEMARQKRTGNILVTTGPYARVRHPQHLGILLFLLPFAFSFSLTARWSTGIRPGDILSWSLMAFLLLAVADYEESRILEAFEEYEYYKSRIPFILPLSLHADYILPPILHQGKPGRYIFFFLVYWTCISLVLFFFSQLPLVFTR